MAAKLPVVASKIGSIPEIVDEDRTGFPLLEFYYATTGYANLESIKWIYRKARHTTLTYVNFCIS
jgi:glycosyltransferase involved in cell wall biosynthesis